MKIQGFQEGWKADKKMVDEHFDGRLCCRVGCDEEATRWFDKGTFLLFVCEEHYKYLENNRFKS